MNFAESVRYLRQGEFLTQEEFAEKIDVSYNTINRWETGKSFPNYQTMKRLLNFCCTNGLDSRELQRVWIEDKNAIAD